MPPVRTTADGRVGLNGKTTGGPNFHFYLLRPEEMTEVFLNSPAGAEILASTTSYNNGIVSSNFYDAGSGDGAPIHHTICDATPVNPQVGDTTNPRACGPNDEDDCYDVTVITTTQFTESNVDHVRLWGTDTTIQVRDPKSSAAQIIDIQTGTPVEGGDFPANIMFEPITTRDGRFLIGRIGTLNHVWQTLTQHVDIVYAHYTESAGDPCDVTKWEEIHPISHAPFDPEVSAKYDFAKHPFRDPEGNPIPDGWDLRATYPWIDQAGKNLFFTVIGTMLSEQPAGTFRYRNQVLPTGGGVTGDENGITRGHAMMGLWTQGKMVVLDNTLNNIDYGIEMRDSAHRLVSLYQSQTGPASSELFDSGEARLASGRDNSSSQPPGAMSNTTFFDTVENRFNFWDPMTPVTPRDVVWLGNNGKSSDEIAFDDYVHPDSFIVSNMSGSFTFDPAFPPPTLRHRLEYHDGWDLDNGGFTLPVRVQNAATALPERWKIPEYGAEIGSLRIEPAALGGVHGKGLWVDGTSGVEYSIPDQSPNEPAEANWFIGLFFDGRFDDDETERMLISFPDGSEVRLLGRHALLWVDDQNRRVRAITLPEPIEELTWSHLGLDVFDAGRRVVAYYNGYVLDEWRARTNESLFQWDGPELSLGYNLQGSTPGFVGWLDDFKVFAQEAGPEVACNHAGGSLVGFTSSETGPWVDLASTYPAWAHARLTERLQMNGELPSYESYACYADLSDDYLAHLGNLPADSIRDSLNFPEGPLLYDKSRPNSSANSFCLSCHTATSPGGLSLLALTLDPGTVARDDDRRQPLQPPRRVHGAIPADWLGTGLPSMNTAAPDIGLPLDEWTLPGSGTTPLAVTGLTLVDPDTGEDLAPITDGMTIDLALWGTNATIRADTNWPTGSLGFKYNGLSLVSPPNEKPFALFGHSGNTYKQGALRVGPHTLTAQPFPNPNLGGAMGTQLSVSFDVVSSQQALVADYRADFASGSPAPGWSYLWNPQPIGVAAGYESLVWDGTVRYDSDGIFGLPDATPQSYGSLQAAMGRTGRGTAQGEPHDHFSIAAYTIATPGNHEVTDCTVSAQTTNGSVEVQVFVNDAPPAFQGSYGTGGGSLVCDVTLGSLAEGDTVYIAVGPSGSSASDRFDLDFKIERMP